MRERRASNAQRAVAYGGGALAAMGASIGVNVIASQQGRLWVIFLAALGTAVVVWAELSVRNATHRRADFRLAVLADGDRTEDELLRSLRVSGKVRSGMPLDPPVLIRSGDGPQRRLRSSEFIEEFRNSPRSIVVTGGPGSGKSTLLRLMQESLARDRRGPVPILVPLRHWHDMSVEELIRTAADSPPRYRRRLPENERILPILDGLDEVDAEDRPRCVAEIDRWLRRRPHGSAVVSSRSAEYAEIGNGLAIDEVLTLEPLPVEDSLRFLESSARRDVGSQSSPQARVVAKLVKEREETRTPLFLWFLASTLVRGRTLLVASRDREELARMAARYVPGIQVEPLTEDERRVVAVMAEGVSYDNGQISSAANLTPSVSATVLRSLRDRGVIREFQDERSRPRYVRGVEDPVR